MSSSSYPLQECQGPSTLEDLTFRSSPSTSLGVELELQILDPETGDLSPGALHILDACEEEGIDGVSGEFLLSMLEVKTGVCRDVSEVRACLAPLLGRVDRVARSQGYELAVGGTHPFNRAATNAVFPNERYRRIQKAQGGLISQEAMFGLHIHVGVPNGERAIGLINLLTPYLPHLLALSANSPFWQGVDTSFASVRSRMFRPSAHAGIPQHFTSWRDFSAYCGTLYEGGVLEGTKDLYWDIRPRPRMGTIEFRIFDAPASLSSLLGLTALTRCLVLEGLRILEQQPERHMGDPRDFWLAQENRWLASRYGLQAECVRQPDCQRKTLAEDADALVERLLSVAREFQEDGFLGLFRPLDQWETGASRQRRLFRRTGSWRVVLDDMRDSWFRQPRKQAIAAANDLQSSPLLFGEEDASSALPWPPAVGLSSVLPRSERRSPSPGPVFMFSHKRQM